MKVGLVLGIDGGGTRTTAWLAGLDGKVRGRGAGGSSNVKAVGASAAFQGLDEAIAGAFADARLKPRPAAVACLGLAGLDRPEDRQRLEAWSRTGARAIRLVLVNDGQLLLAAGTPEGWGLGLIAGTGSIAVGRTPDGRTARAGGWGYLFGDEGSAYGVAVAGLRLMARRADGRSPVGEGGDPLTAGLCQALGIAGPHQLVTRIYDPPMDRAAIAALAPVVLAAGATDPEVMQWIVRPAGVELAEAVLAVARALGGRPGTSHWPLALGGSFVLAAPEVRMALLDHLKTQGLPVAPQEVPEPVRGAVILALQAARESPEK